MPRIDTTKLRIMRREKGLTQQFMADQLGYASISGYNMLETQGLDVPLSKAKIIADIFECQIEDIFFTD